MKRQLLFLLRTYVLTVLLFLAAKVVFLLCYGAGHGATLADYGAVLAHGLSLDLSTALYVLIVPFLVALASVWVRVPKIILKVYFAIIAFALALAFVADTSLYEFWGFKLDASCLQYLAQPEGITQSVTVGYLLLRAVLLGLLTFIFYRFYAKETFPPAQPLKKRLAETLLYVALMPLMVIGIRGGVSESTTNIGQVYYSQNQFLNHAAVNPVFSFLYSLSHQLGDLSQYDFMDEADCERLTANVYTTESLHADTLLTTERPDIVVILLESAGEEFASVMPHLQQLKQEGVYFSRCYGNSWRTDRGTVCALSGYPSFPSVSVMKMPERSRSLPSIARTLKAEGYQASYLYGGDINFTNMRSYLVGTGFEKLTWKADYSSSEQNTAEWGVRDDITFRTLYNLITSKPQNPKTSKPQNLIVPTTKNADKVLNAFAYLDDCLYNFINKVRATPAWERLLVVLIADHGINYRDIDQSRPLLRNHIPMLWLGGAVKEPRTVDAICNQSDLAATLLGQLGLPHDDFRFSRDVLSSTYTYPTAVNNYYNAQALIDSTGCVLYDFDARRFVTSESSDAERLLNVNKAILQLTIHDLQNR